MSIICLKVSGKYLLHLVIYSIETCFLILYDKTIDSEILFLGIICEKQSCMEKFTTKQQRWIKGKKDVSLQPFCALVSLF